MTDQPQPHQSILQKIEAKGLNVRRLVLRDVYGETTGADDVVRRSGRYEIMGEIAAGGIGTVMRARDTDLARDVAIKMLHRGHLDNPELVQRLIEEAQIAGQLQHPAIVPIYELGLDENNVPFIAMKLVKGQTLTALLQARTDPTSQQRLFLGRLLKACRAMAYAHARGVVHRDLKPSNLMVGSYGEVMILDWGFAKVLSRGGIADEQRASVYRGDVTRIETVRSADEAASSIEGTLMGTPAYMPPEQALGQIDDLDARSDVFSLGAILCEILTGAPPYGTEINQILSRAARGDVEEAFSNLELCGADQGLVDVCKVSLAPLRKDRHKDAKALADAVSEHLDAMAERTRRMELVAIKARQKAAIGEARRNEQRAEMEAARTDAAEQRAEAERARAEAREEREATNQARRARKQMVGIASALLAVLVLGGGGYLINSRAEANRQRALRANVEQRVLDAQKLRGEERNGEAAVAARQALELGEKEAAAPASLAIARKLIKTIEAEDQTRKDEEAAVKLQASLTAELEHCRARRSEIFDPVATDAMYVSTLKKHGIDLVGSESGAASAVRALANPGPVLAALDELAWLRCVKLAGTTANWALPLRVAMQADTDVWRRDLRASASSRLVSAVERASQSPPASLEADSARLVAIALGIVGRRQEAAGYLTRAQVAHAGDPWILGLLLHELAGTAVGQEAALRYATALVTMRPELAEMRIELALFQDAIGLAGQALSDSEEALRLAPDSSEAHALHAYILERHGKPNEAFPAWKQAVEMSPDSVWIRMHYGMALLRRRNADAALLECEKAAELAPKNPAVQLALAKAAFSTSGGRSKARAAAFAAQEAGEKDAEALRIMGLIFLYAKGFTAEAKTNLKEALRLEPNNPFVQNSYGIFLFTQRDLAAAQTAFTRAAGAEGAPSAAAWANLGQVWFDREDWTACLEACRKAVENADKIETGPWWDGFTISGASPFSQALKIMGKVVAKNPIWGYAHHRLAVAYSKKGQYMDAIKECREALRVDPDYGHCMQTLIWIYTTCPLPAYRDSKGALELATRLLEAPGVPTAEKLQAYGLACYRAGEFEKAADALERSNQLENGGSAWNWYCLAMARWELGNEKTARRWLAKARAWTDENASDDPELQRFRAEAEKMIR